MHIVYKIVFPRRKELGIVPYQYIGSKSNATFRDGQIFDKNNHVYVGSSTFDGYSEICQTEQYVVFILGEFDQYDECLLFEKEQHIQNDVVADVSYFNKSIATISTYSSPNHVTVRHSVYPTIFVRLSKDHPKVLDGTWINANKGFRTYNNGNEEKQFHELFVPDGWMLGRLPQNILIGEENGFYGKRHSDEAKAKMIESRRQTYANDEERYSEICSRLANNASIRFKGKPKSAESNAKRSRKNMVMLKNKITGECVRISAQDRHMYDDSWVNPAVLYPPSSLGSRWCTDGIINKKLKSDESLPEGFRYGRTNKRKVINEN